MPKRPLRPYNVAVLLALAAASASLPSTLRAAGYSPYTVTVIVDGVPAPEYASRGRIYVEALKGRNFSLRLSNPTSERVAVALSVDGRNVIDAKRTTSLAAAKWILMPGQSAEIPGWQISGDTARRFFFTENRHSYAKWLGDASNTGTIEAVFYREKRAVAAVPPSPRPRPWWDWSRDESRAPANGDAGGSAPGRTYSDAPEARAQAPAPAEASEPTREAVTVTGEAPVIDTQRRTEAQTMQSPSGSDARKRAERASPMPAPKAKESDTYAATGIGSKTAFEVEWTTFDEDPTPAARVAIRYEFRAELVRLGVLPREDDLYARDRGRGFEREYAPDPYRGH
jgi:hypothetical protein